MASPKATSRDVAEAITQHLGPVSPSKLKSHQGFQKKMDTDA
jgi:hypothetical protein